MLCEERKMPFSGKAREQLEMQPAVLAYAFYFSLLAGAEVAEASVADGDWAKPSSK